MVSTAGNAEGTVAAQGLRDMVVEALEDVKGIDILTLDVARQTDLMDVMIIATGTSDRHVKALANAVMEVAKAGSGNLLGMEGRLDQEWVLVDLGTVVVHVMKAATREFYNLEGLWAPPGWAPQA